MGLGTWVRKNKESDLDNRQVMVERQIKARGVTDERVLSAMLAIDRALFIPHEFKSMAYEDRPLPVGYDQTISQPYINAFMIEALQLRGNEKVLEIGTGTGYQAALLSMLCRELYTIEIIPELAKAAKTLLEKAGMGNIHFISGDGSMGYEKEAPFDGIIVSCAAGRVPQELLAQLAENGRMIVPVGELYQELILIEKKQGKISKKSVMQVRFVPMTGKIRQQEAE
jgi:protein-L-isoaspartate(D-aspartate) O-methyltransferase